MDGGKILISHGSVANGDINVFPYLNVSQTEVQHTVISQGKAGKILGKFKSTKTTTKVPTVVSLL